jgi:hypothetical protein
MFETRLPWWNARCRAGFRFSALDALVIVAALPVTWVLWIAVGQVGLLLPVVLGHFFLFCNVFRVPRRGELIWAGLFVVNVCLLAYFGLFVWWQVALLQLPVTVLVVTLAVLRRDYHGLGWSKIRPHRPVGPPEGTDKDEGDRVKAAPDDDRG